MQGIQILEQFEHKFINFRERLKKINVFEIKKFEKKIIDEKKKHNIQILIEKEKQLELEKKEKILIKNT